MKTVALTIIAISLTACGTIDNAIRSDDSIKEKAAFALGTSADQVTISNRRAELGAVRFDAETRGEIYQCYYSTAGVTSDALCSPSDGSGTDTAEATQCNALLKAAGSC